MCCIVLSFRCIFVMHTSRYKMVVLKMKIMKTLIKNLKLGILFSAVVVLVSCGNCHTVVTDLGLNAIHQTIPSLALTATKLTGNRISEYLVNSSVSKNEKNVNVKKQKKAGHCKSAMPITIGVAGARLVSSNNL
jgi:hypothetical protein